MLVNGPGGVALWHQREELLGQEIDILLPERFRARHVIGSLRLRRDCRESWRLPHQALRSESVCLGNRPSVEPGLECYSLDGKPAQAWQQPSLLFVAN